MKYFVLLNNRNKYKLHEKRHILLVSIKVKNTNNGLYVSLIKGNARVCLRQIISKNIFFLILISILLDFKFQIRESASH